jgi:hypothetical protein
MKAPLVVSLLALVVALAALVPQLADRDPDAPRTADAAAPMAAAREAGLLARIDELQHRLAALELHPAPPPVEPRAPATDGLVTRADFDAFRAEVLDALAKRAVVEGASPAEAAALKEQLASTLSEIRKEESVAKVRSALEQRTAALDEVTMPKLEEWLGLSAHQSGEMRTALVERYEREADLTRRWEAGEDAAVLGEQKAADRDAYLQQLAVILTPEQYTTYTTRGGGK